MPSVTTVWNWEKIKPGLAESIARARREGHDAIAADCLTISDTPVEGLETTTKPDGSIEEKRGDMLGHRRLQIETRLKLLAKWDPRYAEKLRAELTGAEGGPLQINVVNFAKDHSSS